MRGLIQLISQIFCLGLMLTALTACGLLDHTPDAPAHADGRPTTVVTLESPNGSHARFASTSDDNFAEQTKQEIKKKLGVDFNKKTYLCSESRETEWRISRQVELQLELKEMVKALNRAEKPRRLTEAQQYTLSKVQLCDPFLFDLRVISKLVDGYDVKELETL